MSHLRVLTLDFETYWSTTHSLSKMSPIVYVTHPDTELISLAYKFDDAETEVIFGEAEIRKWAKSVDWRKAIAVGHNMSGFDAMILAWRLGVDPRLYACTAAMARPWFTKTRAKVMNTRTGMYDLKDGVSLAKLVAEFKVGVKNQNVLHDTRGKRLGDFTKDELKRMAVYNKEDTDQCYALFNILKKLTTPKEMLLVDMTTRMLVCPEFIINEDLLEDTLDSERQRKRQMLLDLGKMIGVCDGLEDPTFDAESIAEDVSKTLGSAVKFGKLLESLGVEVPTKTSPTTGKETPALAKTDEAFIALREHDDPIVVAAAEARLGVKSTLLETRIQAFLNAGRAVNGRLPIPIRYAGADTTGRWSGEQYNPQNLPRIPRDRNGDEVWKPGNALRNCLTAGPGKKVVVADLSGIELRVNHFLWKVPSSMALYQADPEKADLYKDFAASLYAIGKSEVSKDQRQVGKVAHLGLGFGAGAPTFQKVAKLMGGVNITLDESQKIVDKWRAMYKEIVRGWRTCHSMLEAIKGGERMDIDPWGLCKTTKGGIILPSRRQIRYPDLRQETDKETSQTEWCYGHGRNKARIYAGKIDENIVQALARDVIADAAVAVFQETGYRPKLMVHDELVYIAPESEAENLLDVVQGIMRTPPSWWPQLVTWSEGDVADTYGAAK